MRAADSQQTGDPFFHASANPSVTLRFRRFRKNFLSSWFWEGHEFYSCLKLFRMNAGFSRIGKLWPVE